MSIRFIDREFELRALNSRYADTKAHFMVIYGRRRVGKTELIKQFYADKLHAYYLADKSASGEQLQRIVQRVSEAFNERPPLTRTWEELFSYVKGKNRKFILVVDEFPYLAESDKVVPSIFQKGWDEYLNDSKAFLILCGSSVRMMERDVLSSKSPLYGRRTGQLRIDPLKFKDVVLFFPKYEIETAVTCYSILGGIPMYLNEFADRMPLAENIRKMLAKDSILYEEPIFLLREELREPATYSAILEKIAAGSTKMNEISTKTGIEVHKLPKYFKVLENLHIIERVTPVTVSKAKSKQTLYIIKDDFFRFWYYFVFPARSEIEGGSADVVLDQIKSRLSSFTSATFEKICREFLSESGTFNKVGRWWHKDREIDIVALNEQTKDILFAECKWQDRVDARKVLADLKEKAGYVQWNSGKRKEHYAIFAKSFRDKRISGAWLYDLKDMEKAFNKPSSPAGSSASRT